MPTPCDEEFQKYFTCLSGKLTPSDDNAIKSKIKILREFLDTRNRGDRLIDEDDTQTLLNKLVAGVGHATALYGGFSILRKASNVGYTSQELTYANILAKVLMTYFTCCSNKTHG